MKIVSENFWKNQGSPVMMVIAAGRHGKRLFTWWPIVNQAAARIPNFNSRIQEIMGEESGLLIGREPEGDRAGWAILRAGYIKAPNLAAICSSILDLDVYARAHPRYKIRVTYPGIEHIAPEVVEPVIRILPDNVTVVRYMEIPELAPGKLEIKDIYWLVKNHVLYGEHEISGGKWRKQHKSHSQMARAGL